MTEHYVEIPDERHALVQFRQRDLPGFATVNAALKAFEPKIVFAWHLSILVDCENLAKNRLPSPEEQKVLYEFEDELNPKIKANGNALFLARVTHDARREIIWRVYDPEPANEVLQDMIRTKSHPRHFDYRIDPDKKWKKAAWYLDNVSRPTGRSTRTRQRRRAG